MAISIGIGCNAQKKTDSPASDGIESLLDGGGFGWVIPYEKGIIQRAIKVLEGIPDYSAVAGNPDVIYLPKVVLNKADRAFYKCYSLKGIYLETNSMDMTLGFSRCYSLEFVRLERTGNAIINANNLFSMCYALKIVEIIKQEGPLKVSNGSYMFLDCYCLESISDSLDFSECITVNRMLDNTVCLKDLKIDLGSVRSNFKWGTSTLLIGLENLTILSTIHQNVSGIEIYSANLTTESLHSIAINVYDRTGLASAGTFTTKTESLNRMAQEDIDLMNSKNWTVSGI